MEQSRRLALFWLRTGVALDEVYTGTLGRRTATEGIVAEAFVATGVVWPAALSGAGFNEHDVAGVFGRIVPAPASRDARFGAMVPEFERSRDNRSFPGIEPWSGFRGRVLEAPHRVLLGGGNRRIAVFTSGGQIGLAVKHAMEAPDSMFLDVHWRIRNSCMTGFVFSGDRFTLDCFNDISHRRDPSLWTYR